MGEPVVTCPGRDPPYPRILRARRPERLSRADQRLLLLRRSSGMAARPGGGRGGVADRSLGCGVARAGGNGRGGGRPRKHLLRRVSAPPSLSEAHREAVAACVGRPDQPMARAGWSRPWCIRPALWDSPSRTSSVSRDGLHTAGGHDESLAVIGSPFPKAERGLRRSGRMRHPDGVTVRDCSGHRVRPGAARTTCHGTRIRLWHDCWCRLAERTEACVRPRLPGSPGQASRRERPGLRQGIRTQWFSMNRPLRSRPPQTANFGYALTSRLTMNRHWDTPALLPR